MRESETLDCSKPFFRVKSKRKKMDGSIKKDTEKIINSLDNRRHERMLDEIEVMMTLLTCIIYPECDLLIY